MQNKMFFSWRPNDNQNTKVYVCLSIYTIMKIFRP